ncbi:hypothetical protein DSO57_1024741 [Entomophthora muscae]|uniref:Uncharacterized protein n=1 Tax=Entomophthora muscae TaxID=34485 RepID=A0ACC2UNC5_9FUNG|nr:hypothetical protein DSO57_1024741 [Entomophthora muscae]
MSRIATQASAFIVFLALPVILGSASAYHTRKFAPTYYPKLKKPFWAPPTFLLKPLWSVLYILMGISAYLVWREKIVNNTNVKVPLVLFLIQLFFNINWAPLFFRIQSPLLALFCIFFNLVTATLSTISYLSVSPLAAKLMVPYLVTLVILGYLNKSIWRLNQNRNLDKKKKKKKVKAEDSE